MQEFQGTFFHMIAVADSANLKSGICSIYAYDKSPDDSKWELAGTLSPAAEPPKTRFNESGVFDPAETPLSPENARKAFTDAAKRVPFQRSVSKVSASPLKPDVDVEKKPFLEH
jgi:hypothetical protein